MRNKQHLIAFAVAQDQPKDMQLYGLFWQYFIPCNTSDQGKEHKTKSSCKQLTDCLDVMLFVTHQRTAFNFIGLEWVYKGVHI